MSSKLQMSKIVIICSYLKKIYELRSEALLTQIFVNIRFFPPMIYLRRQLPFAAENCVGCIEVQHFHYPIDSVIHLSYNRPLAQ